MLKGISQLAPSDPLRGQNHFTVVRWGLALAVAVGHVWLLTGGREPIRVHDWTASYMAVNGFFVLSGLLIAKSLQTRGDMKAYAISRLLRIYPALVIVLAAFVLFFAPNFSTYGSVSLLEPETWQYAYRVLALGDPEHPASQIFGDNAETDFNGPLWTIRFELVAYILAGIAFMVGAVNGPWRVLCVYVLLQSAHIIVPLIVDVNILPPSATSLLRLSSAFLLGMTLWHWPALRRPPIWAIAALIGIFAVFGSSTLGEVFATWALTAIVMRVGLPKRANSRIVALPDYSYGIYIWHYPIMQVLLAGRPELGPGELAIMAAPLFIATAAISWHVIEKPMLSLKPRPKLAKVAAAPSVR